MRVIGLPLKILKDPHFCCVKPLRSPVIWHRKLYVRLYIASWKSLLECKLASFQLDVQCIEFSLVGLLMLHSVLVEGVCVLGEECGRTGR